MQRRTDCRLHPYERHPIIAHPRQMHDPQPCSRRMATVVSPAGTCGATGDTVLSSTPRENVFSSVNWWRSPLATIGNAFHRLDRATIAERAQSVAGPRLLSGDLGQQHMVERNRVVAGDRHRCRGPMVRRTGTPCENVASDSQQQHPSTAHPQRDPEGGRIPRRHRVPVPDTTSSDSGQVPRILVVDLVHGQNSPEPNSR